MELKWINGCDSIDSLKNGDYNFRLSHSRLRIILDLL